MVIYNLREYLELPWYPPAKIAPGEGGPPPVARGRLPGGGYGKYLAALPIRSLKYFYGTR